MIATIIILISISAAISADEICFAELGCFASLTALVTPLNPILIPAPESLEKINTRFILQTQTHRQPFEVRAGNASMVLTSSFNPSKPIKFIIHGYTPGPVATWPFEMSQDILDVDDVNCFLVYWEDGAGIRYEQAVSNARVVGAQIAQFKASLQEMYQKSAMEVHIIGHSLGAHVAAFAGQRADSNVQRISEFFRAVSCSHSRSVALYRESIRNPKAFRGHRATSYRDYLNGAGSLCDGDCVFMGYHLDSSTSISGNFYFNTRGESPFSADGQ